MAKERYYQDYCGEIKVQPHEVTLRWYHCMKYGCSVRVREEYRHKLVLNCVRLAIEIASRVYKRERAYDSNCWSDLLSHAYIGLINAVDVWDPKKGRLSTIAATYIRHEISNYTVRCRNGMAMSRTTSQKVREVNRLVLQNPDIMVCQVSEKVGCELDTAKSYMESTKYLYKYDDYPPEYIYGIPGRMAPETADSIDFTDAELLAVRLINQLPEIERCVLLQYFLNDTTMEELGAKFGVTKQAIGLIKDKAIQKIRLQLKEELGPNF